MRSHLWNALRPAAALGASLAFFALASISSATVFEVGDGLPYPSIGSVPWESLAAGDTVNIHHRTADYHEKWVLCRAGTEDEPIVVRGIPSPSGELPVINGIDATTRPQLNFWNENRGVIKIGGANNPPDLMPAYLILEGLEIRSGRPPYTFTGRNGLTPYVSNCAAVYVEKGEHITIRGCTLRDCGNGFFCASETTDLFLEHCTVFDNGIEGSIYEHNNYTEALGVLFQFNHFGPLRAGCPGNNLKDRSAGTVIRYNWIEGGNRQLDLVDSDFPELYADPSYRSTLVYGNILIEPDGPGNNQILHYGGDSGNAGHYRKGTLYLHNNTIVSTRTGNTTLARLSTPKETCDARNNILYVSAGGDRLAMLAESGGTLHLWNNWIKPGWVVSHSGGPGIVVDHGNVETLDPGFVDLGMQNFELREDSPAVDAGTSLASEIAAEHTPVLEYVRHALARPRPADALLDIGAFEFASSVSVEGGPISNPLRIRVAPNPFAARVIIETSVTDRIRIVSMDGRIRVDSGRSRSMAADGSLVVLDPGGGGRPARLQWEPPSDLPAGVYTVIASGGGKTASGRMLYLPSRR